jgi:S1-C subfamily serine protease
VPQGGLAAKAGLKPGDIVTQLNDKPVANVGDMENLIKAAGKGDLKFQVMRDEKPEIVVIRQ